MDQINIKQLDLSTSAVMEVAPEQTDLTQITRLEHGAEYLCLLMEIYEVMNK